MTCLRCLMSDKHSDLITEKMNYYSQRPLKNPSNTEHQKSNTLFEHPNYDNSLAYKNVVLNTEVLVNNNFTLNLKNNVNYTNNINFTNQNLINPKIKFQEPYRNRPKTISPLGLYQKHVSGYIFKKIKIINKIEKNNSNPQIKNYDSPQNSYITNGLSSSLNKSISEGNSEANQRYSSTYRKKMVSTLKQIPNKEIIENSIFYENQNDNLEKNILTNNLYNGKKRNKILISNIILNSYKMSNTVKNKKQIRLNEIQNLKYKKNLRYLTINTLDDDKIAAITPSCYNTNKIFKDKFIGNELYYSSNKSNKNKVSIINNTKFKESRTINKIKFTTLKSVQNFNKTEIKKSQTKNVVPMNIKNLSINSFNNFCNLKNHPQKTKHLFNIGQEYFPVQENCNFNLLSQSYCPKSLHSKSINPFLSYCEVKIPPLKTESKKETINNTESSGNIRNNIIYLDTQNSKENKDDEINENDFINFSKILKGKNEIIPKNIFKSKKQDPNHKGKNLYDKKIAKTNNKEEINKNKTLLNNINRKHLSSVINVKDKTKNKELKFINQFTKKNFNLSYMLNQKITIADKSNITNLKKSKKYK